MLKISSPVHKTTVTAAPPDDIWDFEFFSPMLGRSYMVTQDSVLLKIEALLEQGIFPLQSA